MGEIKERPIIFSGPMVRAILEGRKTQTRRVIKPQPHFCQHPNFPDNFKMGRIMHPNGYEMRAEDCPYGWPGNRLWVRETWGVGTRPCPNEGWIDGIEYKADEVYIDDVQSLPLHTANLPEHVCLDDYQSDKWRPSIHMPRWASRITLEITGLRIEKLHKITALDCVAEGVEFEQHYALEGGALTPCDEARAFNAYIELWDSLNAKRGHSWDSNPWVWVIEFRRVD